MHTRESSLGKEFEEGGELITTEEVKPREPQDAFLETKTAIARSNREIDELIQARIDLLASAHSILARLDTETSSSEVVEKNQIRRRLFELEAVDRKSGEDAEDSITIALSQQAMMQELSGYIHSLNSMIETARRELAEASDLAESQKKEIDAAQDLGLFRRAMAYRRTRANVRAYREQSVEVGYKKSELASLEDELKKCQDLFLEAKGRIDYNLQKAAIFMAKEVVEKSEALLKKIDSESVRSQLTKEMIVEIAEPAMDECEKRNSPIPREIRNEFAELIAYIAGTPGNYQPEDEEKRKRFAEIIRDYNLYEVVSKIDIDNTGSHETSNSRYSRLFCICFSQSIKDKLTGYIDECERISPDIGKKAKEAVANVLSQNTLEPSKFFDLERADISQVACGTDFVRWPFVTKFFNETGILTPEQVDRAEEIIIRRSCKEILDPGGKESWEGTSVVNGINIINNPLAIPYLFEHVKKHGSGHTSEQVYFSLTTFLQKNDERTEHFISKMPDQDKQLIALIRNPHSYFNHFCSSDADPWRACKAVSARDKSLIMEKVIGALITSDDLTLTTEQGENIAENLYWLTGRSQMINLKLLKKAAPYLGVGEKELIESLFFELTEHVSFRSREDIMFIQELAKDLGSTPKDIFNRLNSVEEKRFKLNLNGWMGESSKMIDVFVELAELLGEDKKTFIEQHISSFAELPISNDDFLGTINSLAKSLGESPYAIMDRIVRDAQLSDESTFSSLAYAMDKENEDLVNFFVEYVEWLGAKDGIRSQQLEAYVINCLAGSFRQIEARRKQDHRGSFLPNIADKLIGRLESNLSSKDLLVRYLAYDGLVAMGGLRLSRFSELVDFNTPENLEQIREAAQTFMDEYKINAISIEKLIEESLISLDPSVKSLLDDRKKLGAIRPLLIKKFMEYATQEGGEDESSYQKVLKKLREVARVYTSTDYSIIEKRSIFLDRFGLEDVQDPTVREQILAFPEPERAEKLHALAEHEFERILIDSGCSDYRQYLERQLADPEISEEERREVEKKLNRMWQVLVEADLRNRRLYQEGLALEGEPFLEHVIPFETSISQVGSGESTYSILDIGTLCDAFLGNEAYVQESNLESHVCETRYYESNEESPDFFLRTRLASYGNPHGRKVNIVCRNVSAIPYRPHGITSTESGYISMGSAHRLIFTGIASTEITAIVLNGAVAIKPEEIENQKKAVATKGFFIPIYHDDNHSVWEPKEFDEMKLFYHYSHARGYDQGVIDRVYDYYKKCLKRPDEKQSVVMLKAVEEVRNSPDPLQEVDLVVLSGFLANNDLNSHPIEWYRDSDFSVVLEDIKKVGASRGRQRVRSAIFRFSGSEWPRGVEGAREIELPAESSLRRLLEASENREILERNMARMLFGHSLANEGGEEVVDVMEVENVSSEICAIRERILARAWEKTWEQVSAQEDIQPQIESMRQKMALAVTGSLARKETLPDSDLDYNIVIDDTAEDIGRDDLIHFAQGIFLPVFMANLTESELHIDSGKMKESNNPISLLSSIRDFEIDFAKRRQQEEPTAILSYRPVVAREGAVIDKAKTLLLLENKSANLLEAFIQCDLEQGTAEKPSYVEDFEQLIKEFSGGGNLRRIKEALQRTIMFKLQILTLRAVREEKIAPLEVPSIPGGTLDLISFLAEHDVLDQDESQTCSELWAMAYKLRFLHDIFRENRRQDEANQAMFHVDDITFDEREHLYRLIDEFRSRVLFK